MNQYITGLTKFSLFLDNTHLFVDLVSDIDLFSWKNLFTIPDTKTSFIKSFTEKKVTKIKKIN